MDLQLTVYDVASRAKADVLVTAADRGRAGPLLDALRSAVGARGDVPLTVAGRTLPDDGDVADCALAAGDIIDAGKAVDRFEPPVLDVVVRTGPDAGRRFALCPGRYVAGRDAACDVRVNDAAISGRHLSLDVTSTAVGIADLGATNATTLDGATLPAESIRLDALPATLHIGDSTVGLAPHRALNVDAVGTPPWGIGPCLGPPHEPIVVTIPSAPTPATPPRIAVLPAAVPLVAGVALTLAIHQWEYLAFTAISPLMIIGQAITDRRSARRQNRATQRAYATAFDQAHRELAAGLIEETTRRHQAAPDLGELCSPNAGAHGLLSRRSAEGPDRLELRLGLADQPSDIEVRGGATTIATAVPLLAPLPALGTLGILGPPAARRGLARSLALQAAALHDPATLSIVVLAPGEAASWGWVRWLPHVAPDDATCVATVGFDADQVSERLGELGTPTAPRRSTLVIVDGAEPGVAKALSHVAAVIWCASNASALPSTCGAVATISPAQRPRLDYASRATMITGATPDLVAIDVAAAAARRLAPGAGGQPGTAAIPRAVRWGELGDAHPTSRWGEASTDITLGVGAAGPVRLDLVRDGPHALIAGTTGAGKSELLLTMIAELANGNRPDQLSLLLVDHKGGATFGMCSRLPHTTGVVTDLDAAATRRALQSIGAELRRREERLAAAGVADFQRYQRLEPHALPRLVVVVDEFAALVGGDPAGAAELVAIAQRGRSLGLHLILATQRPEGLVSADIRANTRIRICLGVTREQDSRDVLDSPAAAAISRTTPGRAYVRIGPGDLQLFQTARVTGHRRSQAVTVTAMPDISLGDQPPTPLRRDAEHRTELEELIDASIAASERLGCAPPLAPWLPPLPTRIALTELPRGDDEVAWGLADLPHHGVQPPMMISPNRGATTLIIGTTRSGRSTAALSIAVALAAVRSPDELHLWGIDAADGLSSLTQLDHCGAIIRTVDVERLRSVLDYVVTTAQRRRTGEATDRRTLLVVIDGWESMLDAIAEHGRSDVADQVLRLASDGPAVGVHLVVTGGRALLTGRIASVATERIVLRLTDPADYLTLGVARRDLPGELPPGRGIRASDLAIVQAACVEDADVRTAARWPAPRHPPEAFAPLPRHIGLRELRRSATSESIVVGLLAVDHAAIVLSRADLGDAFLVTGARRSGRSNALRVIAEQLSDRPVIVLAHQRSALAKCRRAIHLDPADPQHVLEVIDRLATAGERPHLLVDDIDQLEAGPLPDRIDWLMRHPDPRALVVVSATVDSATAAFRGPLSTARQSRRGLLLRPLSPRDGDVLGIDLRRQVLGADLPGRGWLVIDGTGSRLQVAEPDPGPQPSTELELSTFGARRRE